MKARAAALLALALSLGAGPPDASAAKGVVALPSVVGPKGAPAKPLEKALRTALVAAGYKVLGEKELKAAGKKARKGGGSPIDLARAAKADWLALVSIKKTKAKLVAEAELIDAGSGDPITTVEEGFKAAKDAPGAGKALAKAIAGALKGSLASPPDEPPPETAKKPKPITPATTPPVVPKDESTPSVASAPSEPPPAKQDAAPTVVPKDEATSGGGLKAQITPKRTERPIFWAHAGAGIQAATKYTVTVGATPTALAYDLSPILLVLAGGRLRVPSTELAVDLGFTFSPVKYAINVDPPVTPEQPSGSFIAFDASALYALDLVDFGEGGRSAFWLEPLAGIHFETLGVERQQNFDIVVGWTAFALELGTGLRLGLGDTVDVTARGAVRIFLSFDEGDVYTGDGGSGIGFAGGAGAVWWVMPSFGLGLDLAYEFKRIGFTGAGNRATFENDPALMDAAVFNSALKIGASAQLAL